VHAPLHPDPIGAFRRAVAAALDGGDALLPLGRPDDAAVFEPDRGADPDTAVVIGTSGSTGVPKGVTLSAPALLASATATHERLGGPGHWILALPVHHIAGLQVLVRSVVAETEVSTVDSTDGFTPQAFLAAAQHLPAGRRYAALVPTQLSRLLDAGGPAVEAAAGCAAIIVGGAAAAESLLDRARSVGITPVTTYGMSETSGGCVYDGSPLRDVRVDVDTDGAVRLGGPTLATGYLRRPDLTAAAFVDDWFHTRDVGRWLPDGRLEILGRSDDVVNSGGEKIPPILVERALTANPGVDSACVVGIPDEQWGQVVAAAVVSAGDVDLDALRAAVRNAAGRHAVPKRLLVVTELPMLDSGKVNRTAVAALLAGS
jgi:O-succinylbenzoic acid--CoA ligase